jgi:uncharacterized SAM-binding protein YcdF (DUF218 family)
MLFWLKKAVSYWLMPLPFCVALMIAGLLLLRSTRRPKAGRRLLIAGVLLLFVLSNKQVGQALLRPLESQYAAQPEFPAGSPLPGSLAACRAIVVLGGGHADQAGLSAIQQLSASALSRLTEAVRLARLLPDATLIVSGPGMGKTGRTHASVLAAAAVSLGIDPKRIVQIDTARDTDDEVQAVKQRLGTATPFALVTSAWHMPRAMGLMHRAGLSPVPCPADFLSRVSAETRASDWLFDLSGLEQSTWAIYERLGTTWAKLQGKI